MSKLEESSSQSLHPTAEQCHEKYRKSLLLFLGEGNFSFSTSIALSSALSPLNCCLIATDYIPELKTELETCEAIGESKKPVEDKATALLKQNVSTLKSQGHQLFFDVDATKLHEHNEILKAAKSFSSVFIIFNFPHVKSKKMKIGLNRDLLRDFFMSCDNFLHSLSADGNATEITSIVSLCAGQSGIPEVDVKDRCWGDSWQVNDMAAHGNFVCKEICDFEKWDLFAMSKPNSRPENALTYQSSYYRLQNAVSFTTKGALTFTYEHREHINPSIANRLNTILQFSNSTAQNHLRDFHEKFAKDLVIFEGVTCTSQNFQDFRKTSEHYPLRPYHHLLKLNSVSIGQISAYLDDENLEVMKFKGEEICVKFKGEEICVKFARDPTRLPVTVGNVTEECTTLYMDCLLDLKYNCDYRLVLSNFLASRETHRSLYPRTHEFHISFWLNEKFTMDSFMEVLLNVYGLMLQSLEFVEEYLNISQGRKSTCWRIQVQSLDLPLSRLTAHQLYLKLRQELADRLDLEVR